MKKSTLVDSSYDPKHLLFGLVSFHLFFHTMKNALPIELLECFEICAKYLSFTKAAQELGASQPAVSQSIKKLEEFLGQTLFERQHKSLSLTVAGQLLKIHVSAGLTHLKQGILEVQNLQQKQVLQVQTDFAFASFCLMPKLAQFTQLHPTIEVNLLTHQQTPNDSLELGDIGIYLGTGQIKHGRSYLLFAEQVFPVCSPAFFEKNFLKLGSKNPNSIQFISKQLALCPLLQLKSKPHQTWFDWEQLLPLYGLSSLPQYVPIKFDNYPLLIQAAMAGQGVAIGWRQMVDEHIQQGLLQNIGLPVQQSKLAYYALVPERKRKNKVVDLFVNWLLDALKR